MRDKARSRANASATEAPDDVPAGTRQRGKHRNRARGVTSREARPTPGEAVGTHEQEAGGTVERVVRRPGTGPDWWADPGLSRMTPALKTRTVGRQIGV